MLLLAEGHLDLVMGICVLSAHLSSSFGAPTKLDDLIILCDSLLIECMERLKTRCLNQGRLSYIVDKFPCSSVLSVRDCTVLLSSRDLDNNHA